MFEKVTPWLFASILLLFPLLGNAAAYEAGFADGVSYEQVSFNAHFAGSLDALEGEMEVDTYPGDIVLGFELDSSESIELSLSQLQDTGGIGGTGPVKTPYANPEVGWRGTF